MPLGVIYDDPAPTFESAVIAERQRAVAGKEASLAKLLARGQTWTVSGTAQDPIGTRPDGQGAPTASPGDVIR